MDHAGILAPSLALVVFNCSSSHQIPEQHAEHCVWGQTQEDRSHAFIQPYQALSLAHFQHTV